MVWPYGPTIKQTAIFVCGGFCNIDLLWCFKEKSIQSSTRNFLLKGVKELCGGKILCFKSKKIQIQWKTQATILQQFCKNIFAFCIFWYFMLLRQRKEYWLSFSEGDNIQYIHLGRNMNFSWDRGFYKVGSKLQNRAFQDPPNQNPSCPKNL